MSWTLIDTADPLQTFCQHVLNEQHSFIAIDCEFVRHNTYWPQLGLIQLATPNRAVLIDPVVNNLSLEPLKPILQEPSITKVFHAGHQDIEILYDLFKECPSPIFDTQIAAAFAGLGEGLGYEKLVNLLLNIKLSKHEQFTNWLKRPLRQEQLDYAIHDVLHLREIYVLLKNHLNDLGRLHWPEDNFLTLSSAKTYTVDPEEAWQRLKAPFTKWQHYSILWDLASWREQWSQSNNISRSLLTENRMLIDLSSAPFMEADKLKETVSSYRHKLNNNDCFESFYNCYHRSHHFFDQEGHLQQTRKQIIKTWTSQNFQNQLSARQKQAVSQIRIYLKDISDSLNLPPACLANKRDIESFIACADPHHKLLIGWRRELLGEYLMSFLTPEMSCNLEIE